MYDSVELGTLDGSYSREGTEDEAEYVGVETEGGSTPVEDGSAEDGSAGRVREEDEGSDEGGGNGAESTSPGSLTKAFMNAICAFSRSLAACKIEAWSEVDMVSKV